MRESVSVHPFPEDRIIRRVLPGPALPADAVTVTQHGVSQTFDCEQDLHAAVLVACRDQLQAREDAAVNRALVAQRRRLDAQAAAERMAARRRRHDLLTRGVLLCLAAGIIAALAYGASEFVR